MTCALIRRHEDGVTASRQTMGTHEERVAINKTEGENSEKNQTANTLIFRAVRT